MEMNGNVVMISECWTHEEAKGWRRVNFDCGEVKAEDEEKDVDDEEEEEKKIDTKDEGQEIVQEDEESKKNESKLVKTSCGDAHNLGLDSEGQAYSLPSPLEFDVFPKCENQ